jgi:hypothetical protein
MFLVLSLKDNDRSADVIAKGGGVIRVFALLLEVRGQERIVGNRENVPPERASQGIKVLFGKRTVAF